MSKILNQQPDQLWIHRTHNYKPNTTLVDVQAKFWTLAYANIPEKSVYYSCEKNIWNELKGKVLVFVSPYSLIRWKILVPQLKWIYFISKENIEEAINLKSKVIYNFNGIDEIFKKVSKDVLIEIMSLDGEPIAVESKVSTAEGFKRSIDQRFTIS
ncbi:MAG: hypothetical protein KDD45_12755, partial [Bdellovibrionales bacterium]|nr:hypothetical protein [Bdellovibrionales bacterium]